MDSLHAAHGLHHIGDAVAGEHQQGVIGTQTGIADDGDGPVLGDLVPAGLDSFQGQCVPVGMFGLLGFAGLLGPGVDEVEVVVLAVMPQPEEFLGRDGTDTAGKHVLGDVADGVDHVHGRSERRSVADFEVGDILDLDEGLVLQNGGHGVHPGLDRFGILAAALHTEHAAVLFVDDELELHHLLLRIEVGAVKLGHAHGYGVVPCLHRGLTGEAHAGERLVKELDAPGAHITGEGGVAAGEVGADDAALTVGHAAEGQIAHFAGDEVLYGAAVAAGVDIGVGGLHVLVDHDGAAAGFKAAFLGELAVGQEAGGVDNELGVDGTLVGDHALHGAVALKAYDLFAGVDMNAMAFKVMAGEVAVGLGEHAGQDVRHHFHDGDFDAPHVSHGHSGLETDKAAAYDNGVVNTALNLVADGVGGFKLGQREDVAELLAGNVRLAGRGARGEDQLVVRIFLLLSGDGVAHGHFLRGAVHFGDTGVDVHVEVLHLLEERGIAQGLVRRGAEILHVLDIAAHEVGNAAAAIRNKGVFIEERDFGRGIKPHAAAGAFGAEGNTADDDNLLGHCSCLAFLGETRRATSDSDLSGRRGGKPGRKQPRAGSGNRYPEPAAAARLRHSGPRHRCMEKSYTRADSIAKPFFKYEQYPRSGKRKREKFSLFQKIQFYCFL